MLRIWENVNIVKNVLGDVFLNKAGVAPDRTFDTAGQPFPRPPVSTLAPQ